ncbi:hypothetical protein OG535_24495 [Kitasatospora sp. NBC_00085]|uniref:hypothetical protein n=1 Tax=unclassified Kitasatospora TaxID=2633591 RepID=UPI0032550B3D
MAGRWADRPRDGLVGAAPATRDGVHRTATGAVGDAFDGGALTAAWGAAPTGLGREEAGPGR